MPGGGATQLVFYGQQNIKLNGNPRSTYFKTKYKSTTNFSMESISVSLNTTMANVFESTTYQTKIDRHGDLIKDIYFTITLPDIISSTADSFRWVSDLGPALIDNYSISIGGQVIERNTGEYLYIMNQLSMNKDKREIYNKMTGNSLELNNPNQFYFNKSDSKVLPLRYRIGNSYPGIESNQNGNVSIRSRKLYIPLTFFFNKNPGNCLPLVSLQYSEVLISVTIRPLIELYKLNYNLNGVTDFYAPDQYNSIHNLENFVSNMNFSYMTNPTVINLQTSLEVNYIFLDSPERKLFAYKPLEYLIEQTQQINYYAIPEISNIQLYLNNCVKEIVFVLKRNDLNIKNDYFNYTDNLDQILINAQILFNGYERITKKDAYYFNYVQPFECHTNTCDGIYLYSFSLNPEQYQPSGSVNTSKINKIQLLLELIKPKGDYSYDLSIYATNYNFLTISAGLAGTTFVT